ncbi:hypothetical protein [Algibacillus agarilyticus]|uniref:hypothetical protein n=1 Tax=Algibacillus agarilyticus TaxID=2234133 RepID=UPI000DD0D848|nr:hypothetical protein [Algibacillus agarilyticus]
MFQKTSIVSRWQNALDKRDFKQVCQLYSQASATENLQQLETLLRLSENSSVAKYNVYQQVATKLLELKKSPSGFIKLINTEAALNLFFPAIKEHLSFDSVDSEQRNCLHYLFRADPLFGRVNATASNYMPPFNFIRSLLLFESNEPLINALSQKDKQGSAPFDAFFVSLDKVDLLNDVLFSSVFGLIEISAQQTGKRDLSISEQQALKQSLKVYWNHHHLTPKIDDRMLILMASYYKLRAHTLLSWCK